VLEGVGLGLGDELGDVLVGADDDAPRLGDGCEVGLPDGLPEGEVPGDRPCDVLGVPVLPPAAELLLPPLPRAWLPL
jgi:hypothetical protein